MNPILMSRFFILLVWGFLSVLDDTGNQNSYKKKIKNFFGGWGKAINKIFTNQLDFDSRPEG
jgi:hypothetical protein